MSKPAMMDDDSFALLWESLGPEGRQYAVALAVRKYVRHTMDANVRKQMAALMSTGITIEEMIEKAKGMVEITDSLQAALAPLLGAGVRLEPLLREAFEEMAKGSVS